MYWLGAPPGCFDAFNEIWTSLPEKGALQEAGPLLTEIGLGSQFRNLEDIQVPCGWY